jgi:hypothetical protein
VYSAAVGTGHTVGVAAIALLAVALPSLAGTPPAPGRAAAPAADSARSSDDVPIADDVVLTEMLADAIELRRREDFDRMLDARDPGELVEHATLNDYAFDYGNLDVETLFVVGDELFAYLFRPENGWGGKGRRAGDFTYTPSPRRIHNGLSGGPDAFACSSCHSKGGPDGAGTQSQNAFLRGDGTQLSVADQRNAPHLLGLGPIEQLAREMSEELAAQLKAARQEARRTKTEVEKPLTAKGVGFGKIVVRRDGSVDRSKVAGVDGDLVVKPFGWKGHQATLRDTVEEELHLHLGLISKHIHLEVRDGKRDPAPYGNGPWYDLDEDGVSLEIDSGMLTTVVGYLAQLEVPVTRPPRDPGLLDLFAAGRTLFTGIGCASCHLPVLELTNTRLDATAGSDAKLPAFLIDVARDGDGPKVEPKHGGGVTPYLVHLFSDLRRHDMGADLASPSAQGSIPASEFLTRPLWGLAETAPYLHDGRAPTLHEAIALHGGESAASRDAYLRLDERSQASLRVFLTSLTRQPKLFVP